MARDVRNVRGKSAKSVERTTALLLGLLPVSSWPEEGELNPHGRSLYLVSGPQEDPVGA